MANYVNKNNAMVITMSKDGKQTTELKLAEDVRLTPSEFKYFIGQTGWKYLKSRKVFYLTAKNKTEEEFKMAYFFVRKNFIADEDKPAYDKKIKAIIKKLYAK